MYTQIRLNSVVPNGVGGPEAGALNLIYEMLLNKHHQNSYRAIFVNQIGNDLEEIIIKKGKEIHVNIRYPAPDNWQAKSDEEKNHIRLEVIHTGLFRIASKEEKLNTDELENIKKTVLDNHFSFEFVYSSFINKKNRDLIAHLTVEPKTDTFLYYIKIEESGNLKCKLSFYRGLTNTFYIDLLFGKGEWKSDNDFVVSGSKGEIEIHIAVDSCKIDYKNLTPYEKAPHFELFRSDISPEEKEKARKDREHSLPPAIAAIIRDANN